MCTSGLRALIVAYGWMLPEKPRWCLSEQVCPGSKVYSALSGPEDWILRYIRTCLYKTQNEENIFVADECIQRVAVVPEVVQPGGVTLPKGGSSPTSPRAFPFPKASSQHATSDPTKAAPLKYLSRRQCKACGVTTWGSTGGAAP